MKPTGAFFDTKIEEIHVRFSKIQMRFPKYRIRPDSLQNLSSQLLLSSENEPLKVHEKFLQKFSMELIYIGTRVLIKNGLNKNLPLSSFKTLLSVGSKINGMCWIAENNESSHQRDSRVPSASKG